MDRLRRITVFSMFFIEVMLRVTRKAQALHFNHFPNIRVHCNAQKHVSRLPQPSLTPIDVQCRFRQFQAELLCLVSTFQVEA